MPDDKSSPFEDHNSFSFNEDDELAAIRAMASETLAVPLTPSEEAIMLEIRFWMRREQSRLRRRFETNDFPAELYLDGIDDITKTGMMRCHHVLGEPRFISVFGEAGFDPTGLVDRHAFMAMQN